MSQDHTLLMATRNPGKVAELGEMLAPMEIRVVGLDDFPDSTKVEETGSTFEENARLKAAGYALQTGLPALADDSGLEVDALRGQPGVRSKRWSGRPDLSGVALDEANNARLLGALRGMTDRHARYVCVAAFVDGAEELTRRGTASGVILEHRRGSGGFGYDPYFRSLDLGQTFGEASRAEKERVSHRGRAFRALLDSLVG